MNEILGHRNTAVATHRIRVRQAQRWITAAFAVALLSACGGQELRPVEGLTLVTAPERDPDAVTFDARWSGQVSISGSCLVLTEGETYAVVLPAGSQLMENDAAERGLRVADEDYPLKGTYSGGGFYVSDGEDVSGYSGAAECLSQTGAAETVVIYGIQED